ncbi:Acetyl-CoA synthetase-like protein [Mycena venus]|uniref:Acetyl-CoA synthetase-like protein n=1 Tax=Mycena venus TaxID=2733690 RepID=A0A8H7CYS5_9AGAR|nr:Acetyl-CoA synthetase-like protein [Mycena venus]
MSRSHLTVLETSAHRAPSAIAFKIPQSDASGATPLWRNITYQQFLLDVELTASHWSRIFRQERIPERSVIGLWIGGYSYNDVLNIYGVSRAGFIPQLFSLRLPNADVILELLTKTGARALIYEDVFESALRTWSLPIYRAASIEPAAGRSTLDLPPLPAAQNHEIAFYFHTSGSTSGSPKLVPCSYKWLDMTLQKSYQICTPKEQGRLDVSVWGGSMCHIFQNFCLLGWLQHNACIIQPVANPYTSDQLVDMIHHCGLNRLTIFGSFLSAHLRTSRLDSKLLAKLASLDEIVYTGLPLPREEESWAYSHGVRLRNVFGSTEVGALLVSIGGGGPDAGLLRPTDGVAYKFVPIAPAQSPGAHVSTARILELIVLAESGDCPDVSLRHSDGNFHTGDLFQEVAPGRYISEGRDDDWIKSESSLRCNTKTIEDNARAMCGNLISECIVVGNARPNPILVVEPGTDMDHNKLKIDIIRKTRQFHSRRYLHERITSPEMVIVVPPGSLPRTATKGNIRRKAVEDMYKTQIDRIFGRAL